MASKDEHRDKAGHNEYFVSTLNNPFWDWQVCGMFYAAVHYVQAYIEAKKIPQPTKMNHDKRLTLVGQALKPVYDDYRELYTEGRYARYNPEIKFSQADVQRLEKHLKAIKDLIVPQLS